MFLYILRDILTGSHVLIRDGYIAAGTRATPPPAVPSPPGGGNVTRPGLNADVPPEHDTVPGLPENGAGESGWRKHVPAPITPFSPQYMRRARIYTSSRQYFNGLIDTSLACAY